METKCVQMRSSAGWCNSECRAMRRKTRQLERKYRRLHTAGALSLCRKQFTNQRHMFQAKFTTFWSDTVNVCKNPQDLWKCVNSLLQPPQHGTSSKLSAGDFADFFRSKVQKIGTSTAGAPQPLIADRPAPPLSTFEPATEDEILTLIRTVPTKSCTLDPIPTWLLKCLSAAIAPVICRLCNLSIQTGIVPSSLKHAHVQPFLKKPTLDLDTCCSYRSISNLSYISKLVEHVVVKHFRAHVSDHSLFPVEQSAFHSTETTILTVHNNLLRVVDNNRVIVGDVGS